MAALENNLKTIVRTFRRECHRVLDSERTTIHGADGMLMVLQLVIAEVNKQETGEFSVALSDILMAWKHLLLDKLCLPLNDGSSRPENYNLVRKAYDSFLKRTNTVDLIDIHTEYKQLRADPDPEEPLSSVQLFQFLSGNIETREVRDSPSQVPSTPSSKPKICSTQVRRMVRRVFCSYLDQLINSKNDMAVAHTLDTPNRSLGRVAFTDLKHEARSKNTSLFLAVTSFVRAVQLGGKGYAPAESDPLRKHLKGLSDFVQFTDNLEEILGDHPDPSLAGVRLVTSIRAALVKGRASGDVVVVAADETAKDLKERICRIHLAHQKQAAGSTGISPARPRHHVINHATAYGGRETVKVLMALLDEEALALPCKNKADLLSEDESVLRGDEGTCVLTLFQSPEVPTGSSPKPLQHRIQERQDYLKPKAREQTIRSQFACTYQDNWALPLNRVLDFPSTSQAPSCVYPAPKPRIPTIADPEDLLEPLSTSTVKEMGTVEVNPGAGRKEAQQGGPTWGTAAVLGPRSENKTQGRRAGDGGGCRKTNIQTGGGGGSKACKRKLMEGSVHGGSENQPPQKKPPTCVSSSKVSGKNVGAKAPSKKKLIAGQGKLTSFFRL
ncbi:PCNA-interacting partner [Esox lucius]|uniref:PCNA-interacting partner n=1 Tax=Esox lucius TaxID=8010 RepID=A0A3P8XBJ2_ESOLU|nr:PCNA-interacting partner [Esox lucius]XP_010902156.2 PCNA-interacting partner [Esox lucius]XP_010902157.2 PCNA-interacting partner [Esox lucius]XP_010902158.2 PCNA-interacting partner [Esox lucius]